MSEIEVALAVSARDWPDRIHRFLADHGGARVRAQVLTPEDTLAETYQVLIIDDVCSFFTPRLVDGVHARRRMVLGVFDPTEPDGKERLREAGVDQVIESEATASEFVVALRALVVLAPGEPGPRPVSDERSTSRMVAVGGPPGGCGATEVAIAIALRLAHRGPTVLVDVDESAPSIAQRLGITLLPNLRSAIDIVQHRRGQVSAALQPVGKVSVLAGLNGERDWMEIRPFEVLDVLSELSKVHRYLVVNVGAHLEEVGFGDTGRFAVSRAVLGTAHLVMGVGLPTPVSISRLAAWTRTAADINPHASVKLVVNRRPRPRFHRAEVVEELGRATGVADITLLPDDPQVEAAAWAGKPATTGRFHRSIGRLTDRVVV
ncbi:MAG: AAA family ATPase [Actinomycetota bacterium]